MYFGKLFGAISSPVAKSAVLCFEKYVLAVKLDTNSTTN
jgi:hypothetical protein